MSEVRGPVAPKDPTAKRPFYFVMKDKDICASPDPAGGSKGVQFIYESDGRLKASAKLVGQVEDEAMLSELDTVSGFRGQVHSIGVAVQKAGEPVDVKFVFQMYGHTDPYKSGTELSMEIASDGMEMVMDLSQYAWSDDDDVPGQIRFEFPEAGTTAKVSVCFYLNDGYSAPPQGEDDSVDTDSSAYREMIGKSLKQLGNVHRLKSAIEKARRRERVEVAFIGGSITQGAGAIPINTSCYAYGAFKGFCDVCGRGYEDNISYTKAGVGGTPSEVGMLRYAHDVTDDGRKQPDVVIVEFAVNDEGDETKGECYDSLVRKIYNSPQKPAVILLFSVFVDGYNLQDRLQCVGEAYHLPMVSIKDAVYEQFYLDSASGGVISKRRFFYDMYHPANAGHTIMADSLTNLFAAADQAADAADFDITGVTPPKGGEFENVYLVDRYNIDDCPAVITYDCGAFDGHSTELQMVERDLDLTHTAEFSGNWFYDGKGTESAVFRAKIKSSAILIAYMDSADPGVGNAIVYVDGEKVLDIDPHIVGWQHCNALIAHRGGPAQEREVEIQVPDGTKRFTFLGFGIV